MKRFLSLALVLVMAIGLPVCAGVPELPAPAKAVLSDLQVVKPRLVEATGEAEAIAGSANVQAATKGARRLTAWLDYFAAKDEVAAVAPEVVPPDEPLQAAGANLWSFVAIIGMQAEANAFKGLGQVAPGDQVTAKRFWTLLKFYFAGLAVIRQESAATASGG